MAEEKGTADLSNRHLKSNFFHPLDGCFETKPPPLLVFCQVYTVPTLQRLMLCHNPRILNLSLQRLWRVPLHGKIGPAANREMPHGLILENTLRRGKKPPDFFAK